MRFAPTTAGKARGSLTVTSSDGANLSVTVGLRGTGDPGVPTVNKPDLAFGWVAVGSEATLGFNITNTGRGLLHGSVSMPAAPFSVTSGAGSFALDPGSKHRVAVRFAPTERVQYNTTIVITSDDPAVREIAVSVHGIGRGQGSL
jgi:Abnormal spindle-like microcephaly-assoc'd, ASPM-SPD-2-Hydin